MIKSIIHFIRGISPFNNDTEMSKAEFVVKKLLGFVLVYGAAAVVGEAVVIGILTAMGYDPLHGVMPDGALMGLMSFGGFAVFGAAALIYCRLVEKRGPAALGLLPRKVPEHILGGSLAVALLLVIAVICCLTGAMSFEGFSGKVGIRDLILFFFVFIIQGAAEEILCRGFLMTSLRQKLSLPAAVNINAAVFILLHMMGTDILGMGTGYAVCGIVNLYLISVIFSLLAARRENLWIACGLHSVWNFVLYCIMGINLSGNESSEGVFLLNVHKANIINGGEYGLEAGLACTVALGVTAVILIAAKKGRD